MYGLIGKKLDHSFSADFFNKKFENEKIEEVYKLLPIPSIDDLPQLLQQNPDLKGLNVTIPYKQSVLPYLDDISEEAQEIGAVNVIKIGKKNNKIYLKGFNTDCKGFQDSLKPLLHPEIKKALILGTGGASKAISYVLKKLGIKYKFVSRNPKPGQLSYTSIDKKIMDSHLLIINTTPLGMYPDSTSYPDLPYECMTERHICYDLVYNPIETEFMKRSKKMGSKVKNGMEMLEGQAIAAWKIWNR